MLGPTSISIFNLNRNNETFGYKFKNNSLSENLKGKNSTGGVLINCNLINCRSIYNKNANLSITIKDQNLDLICLTETWETELPIIIDPEITSNFKIFSTKRLKRKGGGCAILCKKIS